ncbi:hypothetical protein [Methanoculleus chikugoensis]|uniref:Lycopene cyclase domain protein n=1 Tax=Methanoculleus chikugoensis TaxID=118126 RepID=A0ABN5XMD3_9EURY|nr:hypothetical protein [Methanoculleus chikugoensis]BBL68226.1 hypothetical protein MchiMG62_14070 [Methanoculleus chikugoensis]
MSPSSHLTVLTLLPCGQSLLAKRASPRLLAYAGAVLMLFPLAWELVVDFRFATSCWEGYHFWIPVVEYVWYIQYAIFPL